MIKLSTEKELVLHAVEIAVRTRREIEDAGLFITDFEQVAHLFDVTVVWGKLPVGTDGSYLKDERKIVLSTNVATPERINFSFCHEIMHARIEDDAGLLSDFADAYRRSDEEAMERLCNAGAAELLMPTENIRQIMVERDFSTILIPELCKRFRVSSVAVAFQMVNCASHDCYLVIAESQMFYLTTTHNQMVLPNFKPTNVPREQLVIVYSGKSSSAKYSIKRTQTLSNNHFLYEALHTNEPVRGYARLPFASGNGWDVPCEALHFRGKVFAFFNVTQPVSNHQLPLF